MVGTLAQPPFSCSGMRCKVCMLYGALAHKHAVPLSRITRVALDPGLTDDFLLHMDSAWAGLQTQERSSGMARLASLRCLNFRKAQRRSQRYSLTRLKIA
jgi:hypothetical protein